MTEIQGGQQAQIEYDLLRMRTDENASTINKAISYLRCLPTAWFLKDDARRMELFKYHVGNCKAAVKRGDVYVLRCQMYRWY